MDVAAAVVDKHVCKWQHENLWVIHNNNKNLMMMNWSTIPCAEFCRHFQFSRFYAISMSARCLVVMVVVGIQEREREREGKKRTRRVTQRFWNKFMKKEKKAELKKKKCFLWEILPLFLRTHTESVCVHWCDIWMELKLMKWTRKKTLSIK